MGQVRIREHSDLQRSRAGSSTPLFKGPLVTDELGESIKVVTVGSDPVDCPPLTRKTHFVAIEAVDSDIRYKVRPKSDRWTRYEATGDDTPVAAGAVQFEAVYPGAIISFLQTSDLIGPGGPGGEPIAFQPSYVPVLAL